MSDMAWLLFEHVRLFVCLFDGEAHKGKVSANCVCGDRYAIDSAVCGTPAIWPWYCHVTSLSLVFPSQFMAFLFERDRLFSRCYIIVPSS